MKESVIYQDWFQQGFEEAFQRGLAIAIIDWLKRFICEIELEDETNINSLSIEELQALGEALLDFSTRDDLLTWLDNH